jgi:hypothetical protein
MKSFTFSQIGMVLTTVFFLATNSLYSQTCGSTISSFPYNEGFESGIGGWTHDGTDDLNWANNSGGTPSNNTGPSTAANGTDYMYVESSSPNYPSKTTNLQSPCLNLTSASTAQFSFKYHMYGANMGSLKVEVSTDDGSTYPATLWTQTGEVQTSNGQAWNTASINLNAYVGSTIKLRFNGTTGSGYRSDMSIDTVSLTITSGPEINIRGNGTNIADNDTTPSLTDDTDFGNIDVTLGTNPNTFTIQNLGVTNLNLTGAFPYVVVSGAHSGDFTVTANPSTPIAASGNTTFTITFNPSATGLRTATISIANNDSNENPYNFNIQGTGATTAQEINIRGNAVDIADDDSTPSFTDDTDFGNVDITGGTNVNTFTIQNLGTSSSLNLTGASPYIVVSGTQATDFTVTAIPSNSIAASSSTTFNITFNPSALGLRTATLTIANNDSNENPYNFNIRGTGTDACGGYVTSFPYTEDFETGIGQWTQDTGDNFNWTRQTGTTPTGSTGPFAAASGSYYMYTEADGNNSSTANFISPCFDLTGTTNPRFTFVHHLYGSNIGTLSVQLSTDSGVTFPTTIWTRTADVQKNTNSAWIPVSIDLSSYVGQTIKLRIQGITGSGNNSDIAIDNVRLTTRANPTYAPGGVTSSLSMWLKGNDGSHTDGQSVAVWQDKGIASDAKAHLPAQEPTFRDNTTKNINFNPVVEFDNSFATYTVDDSYLYNDTSRDFLEGDYGLYTQEMFIVLIPDETPINNSFGFMDVFCGDAHLETNAADATGIGLGDYTGRVSNEIICYAHDSYSTGESNDGYAVAEIGTGSSYDNVGIINARNNSGNTQQELFYNARNIGNTQNDIAEFMNANDSRFWLGRSEGWKASLNARVAEVISYKVRKTDANLTQERNRIQSYLGIKYGITLGVNGTSQDYVNSDGTLIWDKNTGVPSDDVFNYDIAGIGRDDASELYQKQSRSVNNQSDATGRTQGVLTMGINTIYDTNNLNPNTLVNKQFLIWGNDGADLNDPAVIVDIDMSTSITPAISGGTHVQFNGISRTWKVIERGGDIPSVQVAMLKTAIRTATPPDGRYLMFISDTPNFDPTADYRVMTEATDELGEAILKTDYDFDGTKYITFGWAPEREFVRSIYFDPANNNYIDMENALDLNTIAFTVSAWINRKSSSYNTSIVSKRNASYTEGYDLKINGSGQVEMSWKNGSTQTITSTTVIPEDEWHQVAVIYSGGQSKLYIDGVLDKTATMSNPPTTTQSFYIAAAAKNTPEAFFHGNIDEVRVWNTALTVDQLHYIMNQEIEDNASFVGGSYFISRGVTPSKNEVATIPWTNLEGYYPMSVYTYTNTKDESGNGHQGALRALRTVDKQTAPLPYVSAQAGSWETKATWTNGTLQTIPGKTSIVDPTKTVDWNIVETNHNINMDNSTLPAAADNNRNLLALLVDSNTVTVDGNTLSNIGYGLTVSHYLKLDGKIDLEGESQLVQTLGSDLDPTSSGALEKDQQGTADTFTYNYWSSAVGVINATTNNNTYKVTDVMRDGILPVNFLNSGYDGTSGDPIGIADYWIWKFTNQLDGDYSAWQHVRRTGTILPGEGYTMKGPGTGSITDDQNYVFLGKPNNGDITLTINDGNDYLVGNPYASAMDADQFITDNGPNITGAGADPLISGTLYFWEHWGGGNHNLQDYQGGYATYNFSGGVGAPSLGTNDPDVSTEGTPTKLPGRYIPVSQGFFVVGESNGSINFNNGQRVYKKESNGTSVFMRSSEVTTTSTEDTDNRMKFRIGFNSINTIHRQLLLAIDENASIGYDWGYDGKLYDDQMDDLFWMIDNEKYSIQATDPINIESVFPLGIKTNTDGLNTITIDALENVPNDVTVYIHDKEIGTYHNLSVSDFEFYLVAGEYLNKYEITFRSITLGVEDNEINSLEAYYSNELESVVLLNPTFVDVKSIELLNILGQSVHSIDTIASNAYSEYIVQNLSAGSYILKINTESGSVSKKVLIK